MCLAFVFHQGNASLITTPLTTIPLDSYKLNILTTPCPATYGSVVTVTFHPPVSNNLASRRPLAAFGAAFTKPLLIPSVSFTGTPHCLCRFLSVIASAQAIQWHSLPLPFILHSCGFAGSLLATVLKAFNTALLFWLKALLPIVFIEDQYFQKKKCKDSRLAQPLTYSTAKKFRHKHKADTTKPSFIALLFGSAATPSCKRLSFSFLLFFLFVLENIKKYLDYK